MKPIAINITIAGLIWCILFTSCCGECREDFYKAIEQEIRTIDTKIKELELKAADLGEEAKVEYHQAIEKLKVLKETATARLAELKSAGDDAWQEMKPAINNAVSELKKGFEKASAAFK
ncbi:MAG: hypothetical protein KJ645_13755 [Planctomycetes bacterium]|nr:hypothetical protein [Planctomycetota bacterium]